MRLVRALPYTLLLGALFVPLITGAQSEELRATIRAQLLKDPRTASLTSAQLDVMVNALAGGAEKEGITSADIVRDLAVPTEATAPVQAPSECAGMPRFFCAIESGLGLDGSNTFIPLALLATSGLLAFLLYEMKHHAHRPPKKATSDSLYN